jgi:archaellin
MNRNFKFLLIAVLVVVIAGGSYAFAAANTVEASAAGYTANVVSGYTVSLIVYNLNATDPTLVDTINFTVSPTTGASVAKLTKIQTADAGAWTDCVVTPGTAPAATVVCTITSTPLAAVTALNIVASSSLDPA